MLGGRIYPGPSRVGSNSIASPYRIRGQEGDKPLLKGELRSRLEVAGARSENACTNESRSMNEAKEGWDRFAQELFYHKLRLLPWKN